MFNCIATSRIGGINMKNVVKNFKALVNAWADDEEVLELIEDNMNAFPTYVSSVYNMEYHIQMVRIRYKGEPEKIQDITMTLDSQRRMAHESAIRAVTQLCRWATIKGVDPIYHGNLEDRYEIADFCRDIVLHFFDNGRGTHTYDHKKIDELMGTKEELE